MDEIEETKINNIDKHAAVLEKRTNRTLEHEQKIRRIQSGARDSEVPNIGKDRLLHKLRKIHGPARYDFPAELMDLFKL